MMVAVVFVVCVVNLVAFVCQMGVDIPTSAAVDGRDSDHRRRCVIVRVRNTASEVY